MALRADHGIPDAASYYYTMAMRRGASNNSTPQQPPYDGRLIMGFATWALVILSGLFMALRVWCKIRRHRGVGHDDYWLIAAWISLTLGATVQTIDARFGFGVTFSLIDEDFVDDVRLISIVAGFFYIIAVGTSKISFALTLLRITTGGARRFVIAVIIAVSIAFTLSALLQWIQCWPIDVLWHQGKHGKCLPLALSNGYNMLLSAFSATMDVMLALLPWGILWNLTMRRAEKLGVLVAMSMGIFAGVASVLKAVAVHQLFIPHATAEVVVRVMVFGAAESAVSIIAISIPILRTLFKGESKPMVVESFLPPRSSIRSWLPRFDHWRGPNRQPEPWELNARRKKDDDDDDDANSMEGAELANKPPRVI